jgi:hypothetical protein
MPFPCVFYNLGSIFSQCLFLGVWKVVFAHLMQILYACVGDAIECLDKQ